MSIFKKIVQMRNEGLTQSAIALQLNLSPRTVIRYLKNGKIPVYEKKVIKPKLIDEFIPTIKKLLELHSDLTASEIYQELKNIGFTGSLRSVERYSRDLRIKAKEKIVFFAREVRPSEAMEGDFTELEIEIGRKLTLINIWVVSLPYSNAYMATPFLNQKFESFAAGTVAAFEEFGGVAEKYRLDNLSPAVSKILSGKNRTVTRRYKELQDHYNFKQDFCNRGAGWEKGNVESNNRHFKQLVQTELKLRPLKFNSLEAFKVFLLELCRKHNQSPTVKSKFAEEQLAALPKRSFKTYRSEVVKINKYSTFSIDGGRTYSAPSDYIGLHLEARVYSDKVELLFEDQTIDVHPVQLESKVQIKVEHIIDGLCKKPGALNDWKYRDCVFITKQWEVFYQWVQENYGDKANRFFLHNLKLIKKYDRISVSAAVELLHQRNIIFSIEEVEELITNNKINSPNNILPFKIDLQTYDELLTQGDEIETNSFTTSKTEP